MSGHAQRQHGPTRTSATLRSRSVEKIAKQLRDFRRRIAPPESSREKWLRLLYVPIVSLLPQRLSIRLVQPPPNIPVLTYFENLGVEALRHRPVRRILLLKLDHLGDFIVGLRAISQIRDGFPDARVTLVCASWNRTWAEQLGWFDKIVCFDFFTLMNRNWSVTHADLMARYDAFSLLSLDSYDLAVDLRHDADTRPCLYRVDARFRAGFYAPAHEGLPYLDLALPMTEGIAPGHDLSVPLQAELRLQMLAASVVAAFAPPGPHPAAALLAAQPAPAGRPFAVLAIGAGDSIRYWPIERYGEVGSELIARHGLDIVVVGGPNEQADAERLAALLPAGRTRTAIGRPLVGLPDLVAGADLCVCNGSGVSHLAAALGVPTVCILSGASRMHVWRPAGANVVSIGGMTSCQPCGLKQASDCPWDVACLTVVSTAHVLDACARLLAAQAQSDAAVQSEAVVAG